MSKASKQGTVSRFDVLTLRRLHAGGSAPVEDVRRFKRYGLIKMVSRGIFLDVWELTPAGKLVAGIVDGEAVVEDKEDPGAV